MRYKLAGTGLLVLLAVLGSAWAFSPAGDAEADCTSCTARHLSLQRLQQARAAQPDLLPDTVTDTLPDDPAAN